MSFENTQYARTLFCKQIPDAIKALNRIADSLESKEKKVFVCYEENSPSLSVECDNVSNMIVTTDFDAVKEWFNNTYNNINNYKPVYSDDLSSFYENLTKKENSSIALYKDGYEDNPLYYIINVRVFEV